MCKFEWPTVHESVCEDHDRVVEVSVLLSDHSERRSLLLLRRLSRCDARRQVDDHHVCGWWKTETHTTLMSSNIKWNGKRVDYVVKYSNETDAQELELISEAAHRQLCTFLIRCFATISYSVCRDCWCFGAAGRPSGSRLRAVWLHQTPWCWRWRCSSSFWSHWWPERADSYSTGPENRSEPSLPLTK